MEMLSGNLKRKRVDRVSPLPLPPGQFMVWWRSLGRADVLLRLGLCLLTAIGMWLTTTGWKQPFAFRTQWAPPRNLTARVDFLVPDQRATEQARETARRDIACVYVNRPQALDDVQQALIGKVYQVVRSSSFAELDISVWREFLPPPSLDAPVAAGSPEPNEEEEQAYDRFHAALADDEIQANLRGALQQVLAPYRKTGLLESLEHELSDGRLSEIEVVNDDGTRQRVNITDARIGDVVEELATRLRVELGKMMPADAANEVSLRLHTWLKKRLPTTLAWDIAATHEAAEAAARATPIVSHHYAVGDKLEGIQAGVPLSVENIQLLRREHEAFNQQMTWGAMVARSAAQMGMYAALYLLCGIYISIREPKIISELRRFATILALVWFTVALAWFGARDAWRVELIPVIVFAMMISIAYKQELALLLSSSLALIVTLSFGQGLAAFVIMVASSAAAIVHLGGVRNRTKLIYVGLFAAVVAGATAIGVGILTGQNDWERLLVDALWYSVGAVTAGVLLTGLLPFVESLFDVQTELSLLELGDAAHPVLQELVRRAPGTYNHSINVASMAEAAAEAVGANGLLVRVGAYFHDIGKMLKPNYYIENQVEGGNRHDTLAPAMSTLVIISHVKDGADLARQHRLPQSIIDFIEQHHGTTLVEYFYQQANRQSESDPDSPEVDETSYRYPGPKPQSKEAAIMMLADAVESASRTLVEPTPARLESLVNDISMKRLLDGQFDECDLSLGELRIAQDSLIKTLTAVYHGRVKYPDQQTA